MFKVDKEHPVNITVSNDVFCYVAYDEEPLDDLSWADIEAFNAKFPNGVEVLRYEPSRIGAGYIEMTVAPYIQDSFHYDMFQWLGTMVRLELVANPDGTVDVWQWSSTSQSRVLLRASAPILTNQHGGQYIETGEPEGWRYGRGCMWPMKHFQRALPDMQ